MNTITPKELSTELKTNTVCIVDVRSLEKYEKDHIMQDNVNSIHIPKTQIFKHENEDNEPFSNLPIDQRIIVTCTTGNSARRCATILAEKGHDVLVLDGGITAWNKSLSTK